MGIARSGVLASPAGRSTRLLRALRGGLLHLPVVLSRGVVRLAEAAGRQRGGLASCFSEVTDKAATLTAPEVRRLAPF